MSHKLTEYFVNENKKKELTAKKKREAARIARQPGVADIKPRRTRMIKKKVSPPPSLPQELQDEVTTEAARPTSPSEEPLPKEPPYENAVSSTFYPPQEYNDEAEGPDNKRFKQMFEGILKQLEVFQDPVEVKTFLKETRQRRKVLIDIPFVPIEEIPNGHSVLLINEPMMPALAWRLLKELFLRRLFMSMELALHTIPYLSILLRLKGLIINTLNKRLMEF
jgi:hypothetical protein